MPRQKESCYTCREFDAGVRTRQTHYYHDLDEYLGLFGAARPDQLIGEGCIYNVYSSRAPAEIRDLNPDARILIQLRDPLEQMYSNHALKLMMLDTDDKDFGTALKVQQVKRAGRSDAPEAMVDYDLRDKATISPGLRRFIDTFGRDRVHVSLFEEFRSEPQLVLTEVFSFLGVDPGFKPRVEVLVPNRVARVDSLHRAMASPPFIERSKRLVPRFAHPLARAVAQVAFRLNRRQVGRAPLDPAVRDQLRAEFGPEVDRLSALVGIDLRDRWWSDT